MSLGKRENSRLFGFLYLYRGVYLKLWVGLSVPGQYQGCLVSSFSRTGQLR